MTLEVNISAPKIPEQLAKLERANQITTLHSVRAMQQSVVTVISAVRPNVPVGVSARLRRSIVSKVSSSVRGVVGSVFSSLTSEKYPEVMEFGRRPGARMPPPSALERWVRLKLGVPPNRVAGVAFVIARSIARKGIKGRFFMKKGLDASRSRINGFFKRAGDNIIKDLSVGN